MAIIFQITLDLSTVWENLKPTQWTRFVAGFRRFWLDPTSAEDGVVWLAKIDPLTGGAY
jgi:hypothetical protein